MKLGYMHAVLWNLLECEVFCPISSKRNKKNAYRAVDQNVFPEPSMAANTSSLVGKAGIAPLSLTVNAPQPFANHRAPLSRFSSWKISRFSSNVGQNEMRKRPESICQRKNFPCILANPNLQCTVCTKKDTMNNTQGKWKQANVFYNEYFHLIKKIPKGNA